MLHLVRRFRFSASHRLSSPALDAPARAAAYGACEQLHGHNYRLEVSVHGQLDPATGFVCNVLTLAEVVTRLVVDPCEHRLLNDVPLFAGITTTMENLSLRIWDALRAPLAEHGMVLDEVLLAETDDHWVRRTAGSLIG
jgi:6-pyruvoyltetrahydropterin/6-carboxytetrahydropterin synthase